MKSHLLFHRICYFISCFNLLDLKGAPLDFNRSGCHPVQPDRLVTSHQTLRCNLWKTDNLKGPKRWEQSSGQSWWLPDTKAEQGRAGYWSTSPLVRTKCCSLPSYYQEDMTQGGRSWLLLTWAKCNRAELARRIWLKSTVLIPALCPIAIPQPLESSVLSSVQWWDCHLCFLPHMLVIRIKWDSR